MRRHQYLYGRTFGHYTVTGGRLNRTLGEPDSLQLSTGLDVRYINQRLTEDFEFTSGPRRLDRTRFPHEPAVCLHGGPRRIQRIHRGLAAVPVFHGWRTRRLGEHQRLAQAKCDDSRSPRSNLDPYRDCLDQSDTLLSYYVANELELSERLGGAAGVRICRTSADPARTLCRRRVPGHRPERLQSGHRHAHSEERRKLAGRSVTHSRRREGWRGTSGAFYAWTDDPIIFIGFPVIDPTGACLLRYTNGELFTRTGFELSGEWDHTSMLTPFGTLHYLSGRDLNILLSNGSTMTGR